MAAWSRRRAITFIVAGLVLGAVLYRASAQQGDFLDIAAPRAKFQRLAALLGNGDGGQEERVCPSSPFGTPGRQQSPAYWATTDVRMAEAYDEIPFDELETYTQGWQQGFPIHYDSRQVVEKEPRLEVVVMPHSHNDPGWLRTFEEYYTAQTNSILSNAQSYLTEHEDMSFEWAEISYLELWWRNHPQSEREAMKRVIDTGQLEILTGAWVMTDEANSHYFSTVMQMFEGHEWIKNHLSGVTPVSHWSIDPFGLSPTMAYLAKQAGLRWGVIQRAHYAVKAYLAKRRQLEFHWRQLWAGASPDDDFFTHLMPFVSYDITKTCGPDPEVCCQFDFLYAGMPCSEGGGRIEAITNENVASKADLLADQFWKKAQLYKSNMILVPWGTDFRYEQKTEWSAQHDNLKQLFDHINARNDEYNVRARFGTLKDYFELADERAASSGGLVEFPTLSGDFFTYADRDDHYWSGYFTSRPFHKHMDRSLQHYLRAADILFSAANQRSHGESRSTITLDSRLFELYPHLVEARRALSLFQHHDGVTGTAKDFVMQDYATKMLTAINACIAVISRASAYLLGLHEPSPHRVLQNSPPPILSFDNDAFFITHDWDYSQMGLPTRRVISVPSYLILFNSLAFATKEVVCVFVPRGQDGVAQVESTPEDGGSGDWLPLDSQQLQPVMEVRNGALAVADDKLELCFSAKLPALGFRRYRLSVVDRTNVVDAPEVAKMTYKGAVQLGDFHAERLPSRTSEGGSESISLSNGRLSLSIDPRNGLLRAITPVDGSSPPVEVDVSFVQYGSRATEMGSPNGADITSGAYLFLPDGPARPIDSMANTSFVIISGPVRRTVVVKFPEPDHLVHVVELDVNSDWVGIRNLIDLSNRQNIEVAMHIKSDPTMRDLYTELNAYQFIRRERHLDKLPLQAHFFPMPGAAMIQSASKRLSLLGRQALGVASLEPGTLEVVLDRRLLADDHRGLDQGVLDNRLTESRFRLTLEEFSHNDADNERQAATSYHSLHAYYVSLQLHHPTIVEFMPLTRDTTEPQTQSETSLLKSPLPCDVHLLALRTMSGRTNYPNEGVDKGEQLQLINFTSLETEPQPAAALILHRSGLECRITTPTAKDKQPGCDATLAGRPIAVEGLFETRPKRVASGTLTLMKVDEAEVEELELKPMEVRSWLLEF